jgi:uncharacterized protein YbjT (DUF2867 family)
MTALLLGASGLTGGYCLQELLLNTQFDCVVVPLRKLLPISHPKLTQLVVDFDRLDSYQAELKADVVFCCLGTTIKKVGTKEIFKKIDYEYPLQFAKIAKENGAHTYALVSALGADVKSMFFYSRVKGELELNLKKLNFQTLIIMQPSLLLGDRQEKRAGEDFAKIITNLLDFLTPKKYKAIEVKTVASAMIELSLQNLRGVIVKENDKIKEVL